MQLERDASGWYTGAIQGTPTMREGKVQRMEQWLSARGLRWADVLHAEEEDLEESLRYSERQQAEDSHDYALDDPRSLLMLIRELAPEVEKSIKSLLRNEHSTWDGIINKFAAELVMQAKEKNKVEEDEYGDVDDMFSFLD